MPTDDDADDDVGGFGPPLPPDDRLWRHPSELSAGGAPRPGTPVEPRPEAASRGAIWPIALVAGLVGAALSGGILAVTGSLIEPAERRVVEKVAVTPVVSSPALVGDRGVVALTGRVGPAVAELVVTSDEATTTASGVLFRDDGLLLASAHDLAGAREITVVLRDGRRFDAELVGLDPPTDVAVVAIDARQLPVAVLGSSVQLRVGDTTMALGAASEPDGDPALTTGVVSAVDRRLDADGRSLHGLIQTDAPIEAAWSGGPLVDATGAVIGISTGLADERGGFGYATPIELAREVADQLIATGHFSHAWLGIEGADLSEALAEALGIDGGAVVRTVVPGSPAAGGGLAPDDVITEIGGEPVRSSSALVVAMRRHRPGDQVSVGYWRAGRHAEATVTCDERP